MMMQGHCGLPDENISFSRWSFRGVVFDRVSYNDSCKIIDFWSVLIFVLVNARDRSITINLDKLLKNNNLNLFNYE